MASTREGALPRNNFAEQFARYNSKNKSSQVSLATPSSSERRKPFTFQKVSTPTTPSQQSKSLTRGFNPPFKPFAANTHTTPTTRSTQQSTQSVHNKSSVTSNGKYVSSHNTHQNSSKRTSLTFSTGLQNRQNQGPEKGTITSFFRCANDSSGVDKQYQQEYASCGLPQGLVQEQKKNPPVAMVAPVVSNSSCPNRPSIMLKDDVEITSSHSLPNKHTDFSPSNQNTDTSVSSFQPPGSSLIESTPSPQAMIVSSPAQLTLLQVQGELYRLMTGVCDILSDLPAATITSLFGNTAAHIQRKLAERKKYLSKEQELQKMTDPNSLQLPSPSLSSLTFTPATPPLTVAHTTSCPNGTQDSAISKTTRAPFSQTSNCNKATAQCPIGNSEFVTAGTYSSESLTFDSDGPSNSKAYDGANVCADVYGISDLGGDDMNCLVDEFDVWGESDDDVIDVNELSDCEIEELPTGPDPYRDSSVRISSNTDRAYSHSETYQSDKATPHGSVTETSIPGSIISGCGVGVSQTRESQSRRASFGNSSRNPQMFRPSERGAPKDNAAEFRGPYPHSQNMYKVFTQIFGLKMFRPNQLEAVNAVILGKDCFVLMPTGGGKSLCYQLPAVVSPGVTIVVSPLRSLIQDQVQKLCSLEIPAGHLSSDITRAEENEVYSALALRSPTTKLLYVTPEKLGASMKLQSALRGLYNRQMLARFVIDEAHCISQWGHDFRPDYKRLCELRKNFPGVPIIALTATATPRVRADVLLQLNTTNSCKWFTQSFNRVNLQYSVVPKKPRRSMQHIVDLVTSSFRNQSGIIYCLSRKDCDQMADALCKANVAALSYHAGLENGDRSMVQQRWVQEDGCKVVCATIAFGMGIDKPDVRFVIHHSLPKSVEGYYQEAGRAGRDGLPARCILYYNYSDMTRIRRMVQMEKLRRDQERVHLDNLYRMVQYCENETDCRRAQLLQYFAETFDPSLCRNGTTPCDNCQSQTPYRKEDVTRLVRVIVQSVQQVTREQHTLIQYACALKGSVSNKVLNSALGSLPLYKKGEGWSKHDLERLLHMLVLNDILSESLTIGVHDNVVSYVKLGTKAPDVLSGKVTGIIMNIKGKSVPTEGASKTNESQTKECQQKTECYNALLRLRTTTASRLKIKNPENLVSSLTVRAMSQHLPTSKEEMLELDGVTEKNWKNIDGERCLEITCEYAAKVASLVTLQEASGTKGKSPYFGGKENKTSSAPSVGRGKRSRAPSSRQPRKRTKTTVGSVALDDEDAFDQPSGTFLSSRTGTLHRKPGLLPPPRPKRTGM